jgi:hypothetical protein
MNVYFDVMELENTAATTESDLFWRLKKSQNQRVIQRIQILTNCLLSVSTIVLYLVKN